MSVLSTCWGLTGLAGAAAALLLQPQPIHPRAQAEPGGGPQQIRELIARMEAAWARVEDYQAEVEVQVYREGQFIETKRSRYSFKKPNHIRLDMISPHGGAVLIYPDQHGEVYVKPSGLASLLRLHLATTNRLIYSSHGQRIDQTDLGLLVRNIAHSLTDRRRSPPKLVESDGCVLIDVVAQDHFLPGIVTSYRFAVDKTLWLPIGVTERTIGGQMRREVTVRDLKTGVGLPDSLFRG